MKYILYFFLFAVSVHAQTYHFNYSLECKRYGPKPKDVWDFGTVFFDTENTSTMSFVNYDGNQKAVLYDKPKQMTHTFLVNIGTEKTIFKYSHSNKYSDSDLSLQNPYLIDVYKTDSYNIKIDVSVHINKKRAKTKKMLTAYVTFEKSDFEYMIMHHDFLPSEYIRDRILSLLPSDSKYYISKLIVEYEDGSRYTTLNTVRNTNIPLTVPQKTGGLENY